MRSRASDAARLRGSSSPLVSSRVCFLLLLLVFRGFVAFLNRVGFAHVLPFLGLAVPLRAFLMIDVSLSVDPDLPISATGSLCRLRLWSLVLLSGRCRGGSRGT